MPALFPALRVLLDRADCPARFLLTGSASPDMVRGLSESLAGRIGLLDLSGFDLDEVGPQHLRRLWVRGGFPRSYLAADDRASLAWRENFVRLLLERDMPQLGITIPASTLRRFWTMLAHYHGQHWNAAELGRSLGADEKTARRYLDILAATFLVRPLQPWFENLKKRQVKAPKVYVRDSGLLHALLGLEDMENLLGHPKVGAAGEGFAVEQLQAFFHARQTFYWATHGGAELDLLVMARGKRYGFECTFADAPGTTRSMRVAAADLSLEHLWVVYPGAERYALDDTITALPATEIALAADRINTGNAPNAAFPPPRSSTTAAPPTPWPKP
ncbi:MAG: DUF4143 domain-containing protein [Phycisphaerae bacterium]|nr:DUF4143 domain-containing protein [Phycisphaerae bacterium]